ncbi:hypothetical protein NONO_c43560 [Nocardia nova SH22a]|uniref:Uncharacterized protein n=1 Tax=Nocardia nova SH22a TaxID=1415166 RepID=W5TIF6_9NOCA|nr:hypothetical protein NONO_c43560 [Nocardia nova SH22a]
MFLRLCSGTVTVCRPVAGPGTVAGVGPALITGYRRSTGLPDTTAMHIAGPILIAGGLPVLLGAVARFASR